MKIKTMTASFGALSGRTLTVKEGLNIIEAPNESGKSTWAGFLKAMLYGIDTRDRDKKGHLADKNRYQPWSGAPMEGEITLEWQGRDITIRRSRHGNTPFGAFSAVYTGTGERVPGMTGDNCGVLLTGVGREVFERSAFIGQSGMAISSAPELEKRIAALVSSGQEDVSYSQAEGQLKEWLNRRKVNKTVGLIPKLSAQLEQTASARRDLEQLTGAISHLEGERAGLEERKNALESDLWAHRRLRQRDLNTRFAQAQKEYEEAWQALNDLRRDQSRFGTLPAREQLHGAQDEMRFLKVLEEEIRKGELALKEAEEEYVQANIAIQDEFFNGMTGDEAVRKAQEDQKSWQEKMAQGAGKGKLFWLFQGIGLVLAALGLWLGIAQYHWVLGQAPVWTVWLAAGGYLSCAAVSFSFLSAKKKCRAEAEKITARYNVSAPEEIVNLALDYGRRWRGAEDAARKMKDARTSLNEKKARRENGRNDLFTFVHTFAPEVKDSFGCSAAISRALGLEDKLRESRDKLELKRRHLDDLAAQGAQAADTLEMIHTPAQSPEQTQAALNAAQSELERVKRALDMALGEQKAMGDPAALAAREENLREQLERRELEFKAIQTAIEALKGANARLQERFSPELSRLAGQWLARLTGGRYTGVTLNREMEASASLQGGLLPRRDLALSKGTMDQLYLAVRLAVCQLCLPEDGAPLVLDDALVNFDDGRMKLALECLRELAEKRQILLFTCQSREGKALPEWAEAGLQRQSLL